MQGGGDSSRSGYDYRLMCSLLSRGYHNIDELSTILSLRPDGKVQRGRKDERYIRLTIANALKG